jgi:hypothetical protein
MNIHIAVLLNPVASCSQVVHFFLRVVHLVPPWAFVVTVARPREHAPPGVTRGVAGVQ